MSDMISLSLELQRLKHERAELYIGLCGGHAVVDTLINDGGYDYPLPHDQARDMATIALLCRNHGPAVVFEPMPDQGFVLRCSTPEAVTTAKLML